MATSASTTHLDTPIGADLHAMLKRAAEIRGVAMTDFVVAAVQEAAQRTIAEAEVIRLSLADSERFAAAILSPPPRRVPQSRPVASASRSGRPRAP